jgi:hypothetical protein
VVQQVARLLRQVVVRHQRQLIQEQHQPMVRQEIQPKLAQEAQVVQPIMLELAQKAVTVAYPAEVVEAVVVELPLVVQVAMEQQERLW